MATVNFYPILAASDVSGSVLIPVWVSDQGGTYRLSLTNLATFLATAMTDMTTDNLTASEYLGVSGVTFANLPSAVTAGAGARATCTDATATTFASALAGGGANTVPTYSDGTIWRIG
jgi:hypothetical protein